LPVAIFRGELAKRRPGCQIMTAGKLSLQKRLSIGSQWPWIAVPFLLTASAAGAYGPAV
jgi:hypothetical protein